jgi:hypothetical protein
VTGGTDVTVLKNASVQRSYECTYAAKPDYVNNGLNTATATQDLYDYPYGGQPTSAGTKTYTGTAVVDFDANSPTVKVNDSVNVTDTNGQAWGRSAPTPVGTTSSGSSARLWAPLSTPIPPRSQLPRPSRVNQMAPKSLLTALHRQ